MKVLRNIGKAVICIGGGAVAGIAIGLGIAIAVGLYGKWRAPDDPSAGSGAIIAMLTVPFGLLTGVIVGVVATARWIKAGSARVLREDERVEMK